jgi:hypothetical protein
MTGLIESRTVVGGAATVATAAALLLPAPFSAIGAVPLVCVLPGWALLGRTGFPPLERVVWATALSLALAALCGLALQWTGNLDRRGWGLALGGLALAGCFLVPRTRSADPEATFDRDIWTVRWRPSLAVVGAILLALTAYLYARQGALSHNQYAYTTLWMVPSGVSDTATLGVRNHERSAMSYRLDLVADGRTVLRWPGLRLGPEETLTREVSLATLRPTAGRLEAWLFREDNPAAIYRKVSVPEMAPVAPSPDACVPSPTTGPAIDNRIDPRCVRSFGPPRRSSRLP